jgi:phage gp45-like
MFIVMRVGTYFKISNSFTKKIKSKILKGGIMQKKLVVLLSLVLCASLMMAQLSQTGSINGSVNSPDGTPLPGVTVTITSKALVIEKMVTVTNENGRYRFPSLAPGDYEVVYALEGMNTIQRTGIKVSVGKTVTLDVQMELKSLQENIVVEGQAPNIDRQSTTKTASLDTDFLDSIPATRTLATYFNMTPGVTGNTAHGGSVRDNSYNLDGVNLVDPVVGTEGVFFGMDIMEEISVQSGGLSAEYGSVRGAVVNVVTKSGGNSFTGNVKAFVNHESLMGDNTKGTPLEGKQSGAKYEIEPGFSLGGPIIKDKLWFFANGSLNTKEILTAGYPYDKPDTTPTKETRPYPYIKFTLQPNQNNKFVLSYNFSNLIRDHRGADIYNTEDTTWIQRGPTHVFNAHWTHTFSDNVFGNFKVAYVSNPLNLTAKNSEPNYSDLYTDRMWGSWGYDDINERNRIQVNADTTVFVENLAGSHEIKIGAEGQYAKSGRVMSFNGPEDGYGFNQSFIYTLGNPYDDGDYLPYYA